MNPLNLEVPASMLTMKMSMQWTRLVRTKMTASGTSSLPMNHTIQGV